MRASEAPDKWKLVLDTINRDDYDLANELAVKFEFDRDRQREQENRGRRSIYTYFVKDTTGKVYSSTNSSELSKKFGKAPSYVRSMVAKRKGRPVTSGEFKGWVFWKEK